VQELKRVWKEAEKKVQDVEGLEKIEQDLKRAKVESAWAQVQKAREEVRPPLGTYITALHAR
jgi:acetyl-CoA carboxylase alpha subunit